MRPGLHLNSSSCQWVLALMVVFQVPWKITSVRSLVMLRERERERETSIKRSHHSLPSESSICVNNSQRVKGGVHHLLTGEEILYHRYTEVGQ